MKKSQEGNRSILRRGCTYEIRAKIRGGRGCAEFLTSVSLRVVHKGERANGSDKSIGPGIVVSINATP